MRVNLNTFGPEPPDKGTTGRAGQSDAAASSSVSSTASSPTSLAQDQTSFSSGPARLQTLAAQVLAQPEIRDARVQSLQQAIDNGEYSVLPGQIADALVAEYGAVQG